MAAPSGKVYFILVGSLSSTLARQLSLFQLAFEEPPKKAPTADYLGATPAGTYPLVITPLNFAPAVVAPPAFLFPSPIRFPSIGSLSSSVRGAIPLFAPLKPFPYVRYLPVKTTFYLSEPNLRDPIKGKEEPLKFPFKQGAPQPSFSPIRDTQIVRKPSKFGELPGEKLDSPSSQGIKKVPHFVRVVNFPAVHSEKPEIIPFKQGAPKPSFSPIRDAQIVRRPPSQFHKKESQEKMNQHQQFVRVSHFPTQIGGTHFETRDNPKLSLSAPAGIVQSGQPHFTYEPFSNAKLSQNLQNTNFLDIRTENEDIQNLPTLIEV